MDEIGTLIIWGNLLGCLFAIGANAVAAHVGFLIHRGLAITISIIAAMYAVGYAMLLLDVVELARWSAFYRGVSVVVWPLVWAGPALMSIQAWRHTQAQVRGIVVEGAEGVRPVAR